MPLGGGKESLPASRNKGRLLGDMLRGKTHKLLVSLPQLEQAAASKAGFSENSKYENGGFSTSGFLK